MIETSRLYIRKALVEDLDAIYAINNSEFVLKYNASKKIDFETFKKRYLKSIDEDTWHLVLKESNTVIGSISVDPDSLRYRVNSCNLSYCLNELETRKGYMKEAMQAFLNYLFMERKYDVISARVFAPNVASANLLKSCGFIQEGCLRQGVKGYQDIVYDDLLFSLLKTEYTNIFETKE